MKNKKNIIIFDFDGVLADSFKTFYPLLRDSMNRAGLSLSQNQYRDFFIGNVHQSIKDFTKTQKRYLTVMNFRSSNYDEYYNNKLHKAKLFPKALKFLKNLSKDYILTIASSGQEDNIKNLLERNNLKNLFNLILANSATSKAGMIKKIINKFKTTPQKTIMITDTVGDLRVAKKIGLKTIAVTWGFHSAKKLELANPNHLATSFKMLYKIIKAF